MAQIYLASSWSNPHYTDTLNFIRNQGYSVYNFQEKNIGFNWKDFFPDKQATVEEFLAVARKDKRVMNAYRNDARALIKAQVTIAVYPCGKSSFLELGMAISIRMPTAIYFADESILFEPDLMVLPCHFLVGEKELEQFLFDQFSTVRERNKRARERSADVTFKN